MDSTHLKRWAAALLLAPSLAMAGANDMLFQQRNSLDTGTLNRLVPFSPGADGLFWFNGATLLPQLVSLGSNLSITGGVLNAASNAQVNSDWNSASGVTQILNKPSFATLAYTGQYGDLVGAPTIPAAQVSSDWAAVSGVAQILNKPTIQTIQRLRVQTNTAGTYTWTFPSAYGSGVTPVIGVTVEDASAATFNHQITAISNTSVTVQLTKTTAVTLLGISVLGISANPQAFVHLTAVAP